MEKEDLWIIVLTPIATVLIVWALTAGECRKQGGGWMECAEEGYEHFGEEMLYEDHLRRLNGTDK